MKKILFVLSVVFVSQLAQARGVGTAIGEASYFQTFSRVVNIIGMRNSETEALEEALSTIVESCNGEAFRLEEEPSFKLDVTGHKPKVVATVKFSCL